MLLKYVVPVLCTSREFIRQTIKLTIEATKKSFPSNLVSLKTSKFQQG